MTVAMNKTRDYRRPLPDPSFDSDARPFWKGHRRHELHVQKCTSCGHYNNPPGPGCAKCGSAELTYENLGSDITGTVYTFIVPYRAFLPGFEDDVPYVVAQVEIDAAPGYRLIADVPGTDPADIAIGSRVRMIWDDVSDEVTLPRWSLIAP